jgi:hypothetical protein
MMLDFYENGQSILPYQIFRSGSLRTCGGAAKYLVLNVIECRLSPEGQSGLALATNGSFPPLPAIRPDALIAQTGRNPQICCSDF